MFRAEVLLVGAIAVSIARVAAQEVIWSVDGEAAGDQFGSEIYAVGDLDGDGVAELAVASSNHVGPAGFRSGKVYVYSGVDGAPLGSWVGETAEDRFGRDVAGAGDVDGDGVGDVLIGAFLFDAGALRDAGKAYIYSGADRSLLRSWTGATVDDRLGHTVSTLGDVDGDGRDEVAISSHVYDGPHGVDAGRAYVYGGIDGLLIRAFDGPAASDNFSHGLASAGDVDGDGIHDLIVGAPGEKVVGVGAAYVYSGLDGALLRSWSGESAGHRFGFVVTGAGDVDQDGLADLWIGAPLHDGAGGVDAGKAYVYSGGDGELIWSWTGERGNDRFGESVAGAGDVDGDGRPDLLVGARLHSPPGLDFAGRIYGYSGATGTLLWSIDGEAAGDRLGKSLSPLGDVDGDGRADVAAAASFHSGPAGGGAGRVYAYTGAATSLDASGSCLAVCPGPQVVYRARGRHPGPAPASLVIELTSPVPQSFVTTELPAGPFDLVGTLVFPPDLPPSELCPVELTFEVRLSLDDETVLTDSFVVEAVAGEP